MVDTLKKILSEQFDEKIVLKQKQIENIKSELTLIQNNYNKNFNIISTNLLNIKKEIESYNKIKKYIFWLKLKKLHNEMDKLHKEYFSLNITMNKIRSLEDNIRTLENEKKELEESKKTIENCNNIESLGFTYEKVCDFMYKNNIDIIFTNNDLEYYKNNSNVHKCLRNTNDLILIHKTMHPPKNNVIKTAEEAGVTYDREDHMLDIYGKKYSRKISSGRNTLHFCVNSEVNGNFIGANDWNNFKYSIVVPFNSIPKDKYQNVFPVDTYTNGGIELNKDCYILCPFDEIKILKENNPNVNVIGYSGKNVTGYAEMLITMLGYKKEEASNMYWLNEEDNNLFYEITKDYPQKGNHYDTDDRYIEDFKMATSVATSSLEIIKNKVSLDNPKEVRDVFETLYDYDKNKYGQYINNIFLPYILKNNFESVEKFLKDFKKMGIDYDEEFLNLLKDCINLDEFNVESLKSKYIENKIKKMDVRDEYLQETEELFSIVKNIKENYNSDFLSKLFTLTMLNSIYQKNKNNSNCLSSDKIK